MRIASQQGQRRTLPHGRSIILKDKKVFFPRSNDASAEKTYIDFLETIRRGRLSLVDIPAIYAKVEGENFKLLAACEVQRLYPAEHTTKDFLSANKDKWITVIGCYRNVKTPEYACLQGDWWVLEAEHKKNLQYNDFALMYKRKSGSYPAQDYEQALAIFSTYKKMNALISPRDDVPEILALMEMLGTSQHELIPYGAFSYHQWLSDEYKMQQAMLVQAQLRGDLLLYCYDMGPLRKKLSGSTSNSNVAGLKIEILNALLDAMMQRQWYLDASVVTAAQSLLDEMTPHLIRSNTLTGGSYLEQALGKSYLQIMRFLAKLQVMARSDLPVAATAEASLKQLFAELQKKYAFMVRWTAPEEQITLSQPRTLTNELSADDIHDIEAYIEGHDRKGKALDEMRYHKDMAVLLTLTLSQCVELTPDHEESIEDSFHLYSQQSDNLLASLARKVRPQTCEQLMMHLFAASPVIQRQREREHNADQGIENLKGIRGSLLEIFINKTEAIPFLLKVTGELCYQYCFWAKKSTDRAKKYEYLWAALSLGYEPAARLLLKIGVEEPVEQVSLKDRLRHKQKEEAPTEMVTKASDLKQGLKDILIAENPNDIVSAQRGLLMCLKSLDDTTALDVNSTYVYFLISIGASEQERAERLYTLLPDDNDFKLLAACALLRFYQLSASVKAESIAPTEKSVNVESIAPIEESVNAQNIASIKLFLASAQTQHRFPRVIGCYESMTEDKASAYLQQDWWALKRKHKYVYDEHQRCKSLQETAMVGASKIFFDFEKDFMIYLKYAVMCQLCGEAPPAKPFFLHNGKDDMNHPYGSFCYFILIARDFFPSHNTSLYPFIISQADQNGDLLLYCYNLGPLSQVQADPTAEGKLKFLVFNMEILNKLCDRLICHAKSQSEHVVDKFLALLTEVTHSLEKVHIMRPLMPGNYVCLMTLLAKLQLMAGSDFVAVDQIKGILNKLSAKYQWISYKDELLITDQIALSTPSMSVGIDVMRDAVAYIDEHRKFPMFPDEARYHKDMSVLLLSHLLSFGQLTQTRVQAILTHFHLHAGKGQGLMAMAGGFFKGESCVRVIKKIVETGGLDSTHIREGAKLTKTA